MVTERLWVVNIQYNQYTADVLWSCTLESCMILLANVIPKNSIKIRRKKVYFKPLSKWYEPNLLA